MKTIVCHPILIGLLVCAAPSQASTYHVDAEAGDDDNSGLSPAAAWRSLSKVNSMRFRAGDQLRFKAGTSHTGQFKPRGSGTSTSPITVGCYGEGPPPRIDGEGKVLQTVYLYNVEGWEVADLEISNTGPTRQAGRCGVMIHIKDFGTARHIQLRNLHIHDVNGSLVKKRGGGNAIKLRNEGRHTPSRFDGLLIENCHLARCERNGITGGGYSRRDQWFPNLNVVFRGNLLEEIPGDGIVPNACDGALVEHNIMRRCPRALPKGEAAAGIWPWSCDNTVIQLNEVSDHKAPWDAQGFDSDWNCRNTIIQYNYSHDNEGGFLLVCNNGGARMPRNIGNMGTIVRYNISVNDGLRAVGEHAGFSPTFHISGPVKDTHIYNNLIYVNRKPNPDIDITLLQMDNWGGPWPEDTVFRNNIFFAEAVADYDFGHARRTRFENNAFVGIHENGPRDTGAVWADPGFRKVPGARALREELEGFRPRSSSPLVGAGILIRNNGGRDFAGTPVREDTAPTIGPLEVSDRPESHR